MRLGSIRIENDRDIVRLREMGETAVAEVGFRGFAATRIVTSMLELARNVLDHAGGGRAELFLRRRGGSVEFVIETVDQGPGIPDAGRYKRGDVAPGPRRGAGLGLGLRGVGRMADRFDVQSSQEGSRVTAVFRTALDAEAQQDAAERVSQRLRASEREDPAEILSRQNRELMEALAERDLLMAEMHHRTKNNLGLVLSLMRLSRASTENEETRGVLRDLETRVSAIAQVHDQLQRSTASGAINFLQLMKDVGARISSAFASPECAIEVKVEGDTFLLPSSPAVDLSLVVGELLTNACKYAFPDRARGLITLRCAVEGDEMRLLVRDDGVGLPKDAVRPERASSLGWRMVRSMVQKHGGLLETESRDGLIVNMTFRAETLGLQPPPPEADRPAE